MTNPEQDTGAKAGDAKKQAAKPGSVIESTPVGAGYAAKPAATGGEITPADSNLLGKPKDKPRPAAAKKGETGDKPLKLNDAASKDAKPARAAAGKPEAARADAPKSEPSRPASVPAPVPAPAQRRDGFWPLALGGAVAAGLGAAATIWALPHLPPGWLPEQQPVEVVEQGSGVTLDDVRDEISTALDAQITPEGPDLSALETRLDGIEGQLAQAADQARQAGQTAAQEAIAALPAADEGASPQALTALTQQVEQQAARIEELTARPALDPAVADRLQALVAQGESLESQLADAARQAEARISDAQAEAEKLQQAATESTRRAEALAAIAALQTALDQGVSTDAAADQLRSAGVEPPEAVTAGAPTLATLQAEYDDAARAALRAALRSEASDSRAFGAVGNFLRAQTGARSVTARDGTDPDAVLSRAGAAVGSGDIAAALSEIDTLPESARTAPAMAEWLTGARAYVTAHDALTELSGQTN
ncbi:MAG: hypothetical protein Q4G49_15865 [Paracoccus sp. (in: a-proteobacteria)]|nr:hypothetical protein [Paracoccus sp. (in: a-proteobacteria)]